MALAITLAAASGLLPTASACETTSNTIIVALISLCIPATTAILRRLRLSPRAVRRTGWLLALLIPAVLLSVTYQRPAGVFSQIFGVPPPPAVQNLLADRRYAGGPGDTVTTLSFEADEATIQQLVASARLAPDTEGLPRVDDATRDWPTFWHDFTILLHDRRRAAWENPAPMTQPRLYEHTDTSPGITQTRLLWDAATHRTFVIHSVG